jgi:hypothetical protein
MAPTPYTGGRSGEATVRNTLGQASIATTSRYLHARPEKSRGDYLAL